MYFTKYIDQNKFLEKIFSKIFSAFILSIRTIVWKDKTISGKVIILSFQRIGDAIFSLTAVNSIIKHHKEEVIIFCFPESYSVYKLAFPELNVIKVNKTDFYLKRIAKSNVRNTIKNLHPEIIYDLCGSIITSSILLTSSCKKIIGINQSFYKKIYTHYTPFRTEPHITQMYTDAIQDLMPIIDFKLNGEIKKDKSAEKYFLVHPLAGWKAKEWSFQKFLKLTLFFNSYVKTFLVLPKEYLSDSILAEIKTAGVNYIAINNLEHLIDVIKDSAFLLGNDSGPVHIANLFDIPTFTIYGPTNPDYCKPLKGNNEYIIKELSCSSKPGEKWCSSYAGIINCPSFECMNQLSYEEVESAAMTFLQKLKIIQK